MKMQKRRLKSITLTRQINLGETDRYHKAMEKEYYFKISKDPTKQLKEIESPQRSRNDQ